jgi:hypothetical protein
MSSVEGSSAGRGITVESVAMPRLCRGPPRHRDSRTDQAWRAVLLIKADPATDGENHQTGEAQRAVLFIKPEMAMNGENHQAGEARRAVLSIKAEMAMDGISAV